MLKKTIFAPYLPEKPECYSFYNRKCIFPAFCHYDLEYILCR